MHSRRGLPFSSSPNLLLNIEQPSTLAAAGRVRRIVNMSAAEMDHGEARIVVESNPATQAASLKAAQADAHAAWRITLPPRRLTARRHPRYADRRNRFDNPSGGAMTECKDAARNARVRPVASGDSSLCLLSPAPSPVGVATTTIRQPAPTQHADGVTDPGADTDRRCGSAQRDSRRGGRVRPGRVRSRSTFTVTDGNGIPLTATTSSAESDQQARVRFALAHLEEYAGGGDLGNTFFRYVNEVNATSPAYDSGGTLEVVDAATGTYRYTFATHLPEGYDPNLT